MVLKIEHTSEAPEGLVEPRVLGPLHPRVSDSVVCKGPDADIWSEVTLGRSHTQSLGRWNAELTGSQEESSFEPRPPHLRPWLLTSTTCCPELSSLCGGIKGDLFFFKNTLSKQNSLKYIVIIFCLYLLSCETSCILIYIYLNLSNLRNACISESEIYFLGESLLACFIGINLILWAQ